MDKVFSTIQAVAMIARTHLGELKNLVGRWLKAYTLFIMITSDVMLTSSANG